MLVQKQSCVLLIILALLISCTSEDNDVLKEINMNRNVMINDDNVLHSSTISSDIGYATCYAKKNALGYYYPEEVYFCLYDINWRKISENKKIASCVEWYEETTPKIFWNGYEYSVFFTGDLTDNLSEDATINLARISSDGMQIGSIAPICQRSDGGGISRLVNYTVAVYDNGYAIAWRNNNGSLMLSIITQDGSKLLQDKEIYPWDNPGITGDPQICWNGRTFGIFWLGYVEPGLHFAEVNLSGEIIQPSRKLQIEDSGNQYSSTNSNAQSVYGNGEYALVWISNNDLRYCRLDIHGNIVLKERNIECQNLYPEQVKLIWNQKLKEYAIACTYGGDSFANDYYSVAGCSNISLVRIKNDVVYSKEISKPVNRELETPSLFWTNNTYALTYYMSKNALSGDGTEPIALYVQY